MNEITGQLKKSNIIKKIILTVLLLLIIGLTGAYIGLRIWLKSEIKNIYTDAISQYQGDKIEALISMIASEDQPLKTRNNAIWALGKLNDRRALPALKALQTGTACDHTRFVCQRELKKAIDNLEGRGIDLFTFR